MSGRLRVVPLTLERANSLVRQWHRHSPPVLGHRFSIGAEINGALVGACIVGRPNARMTDQDTVAQVLRLVTDGTPNACSLLYAAAARAARAMGFDSIITFTLEREPGTSLRAAGWDRDGETDGGNWREEFRKLATTMLPRPSRHDEGPKVRWIKRLR